MTAYRDRIAVQRQDETSFSYYECVKDHDDCPVCNKWVENKPGTSDRRKTRCYPERRMGLRPWWKFWQAPAVCSLGGVHDHYSCRRCNAVWVCFHITMQPSAKIHT